MRKLRLFLLLGLMMSTLGAQARIINLTNLGSQTKFRDGDTLICQTNMSGDYNSKLVIEDGATIYLRDAKIQRMPDAITFPTSPEDKYHAGLTCLGNANICLIGDKNYVASWHDSYPAIYVPEGKTVHIFGNGVLEVKGGKHGGAGIGGGYKMNCGNIIISNSATVRANLFAQNDKDWEKPADSYGVFRNKGAAAIGAGCKGRCGTIRIENASVEAYGGPGAPAIGCGGYDTKDWKHGNNYSIIYTNGKNSSCKDIIINHADVIAYGGCQAAAIGSGVDNEMKGNIYFSNMIYLKARHGNGVTNSIGASLNGKCKDTYWESVKVTSPTRFDNSPYLYPDNSELNLSEINSDSYILPDRMTLTDTLTYKSKLVISKNATITLKDVFINSKYSDDEDPVAGIECSGFNTILLEGKNKILCPHHDRPAIYVPEGSTVRIMGGGFLEARGRRNKNGVIATNRCAAIGGGFLSKKGGDIILAGGTIEAYGGNEAAAIGGGWSSDCGNITITKDVTKVTAVKGENAPYSVGMGAKDLTSTVVHKCGEIRVGGIKQDGSIAESPWVYEPGLTACAKPTNILISEKTYTSVKVSWSIPEGSHPLYHYVRYGIHGEALSKKIMVEEGLNVSITNLHPGTQFDVQVAAVGQDGAMYWSDVMNFTTEKHPCPNVTGLKAKEFGHNYAVIEWDAVDGVEYWEVLLTKVSTGTERIGTPFGNSSTFSGLEPETKYKVKVAAVCDGTVCSWSDEVSFTTDEEPWDGDLGNLGGRDYAVAEDGMTIHGTQYNHNCPIYIREGATVYFRDVKISGTYIQPMGREAIYCMGDATFVIENENNDVYSYDDNMPAITVPSNKTLTISGPGKMFVRGGKDALFSIGNVSANNSTKIISGSQTYQAGVLSNPYYCPEPPYCDKPEYMQAANITDNSAVIVWDPRVPITEEGYWLMQYEEKGKPSTMIEINNIQRSPYTLTNLKPNTEYTVGVQSYCSETSFSSFTIINFKTKVSCKAPQCPMITYIGNKSVRLTWEPGDDETMWRVMYRVKGESGWYQRNNITSSPYMLQGLTPGTTYEIKIASTCDPDDSSTWSDYVDFGEVTTASEESGCGTPTDPTVLLLSSDSIIFSWTPAGAEEKWRVYLSYDDGARYYTSTTSKKTYTMYASPETTCRFAVSALCTLDPITESKATKDLRVTTLDISAEKAQLTALIQQMSLLYSYGISNGLPSTDANLKSLRSAQDYCDGVANDANTNGRKVNAAIEYAQKTIASIGGYVLNAAKEKYCTEYDAQLKPGDSDACKSLVANAKEELNGYGLTWNSSKSVADNFGDLQEAHLDILHDLKNSLETQRYYDSLPDKTDLGELLGEMETVYEWAATFYTNTSELALIKADVDAVAAVYDKSTATQTEVDNAVGQATSAFPVMAKGAVTELKKVVKAKYDALLETGDSDACKALVNNANAKVNALAWDFSLSAAENIAILNAATVDDIYMQLKSAVEAQRKADQALATCNVPTNLKATNITENSAVISWTAGGSETAWDIWYYDGETHFVSVTTNPYTLEGLQSGCEHMLSIKADCGGSNYSAWTDNIYFTTEAPAVVCEDPSNMEIVSRTHNSALISWTAGGSETAWNLNVYNYGTGTDEDIMVYENPYLLEGLESATGYQVAVQAACGAGNKSDFAPGIYFTTDLKPCPVPTNLTALDVTSTRVVLTWTPGGSEETWIINIHDDELGTDELYSEFVLPSTMSNLTPDNDYTITVSAICSDGTSAWSLPVSFHTLANDDALLCDAPTDMTQTGDIEDTRAYLEWTAVDSETSWKIRYRKDGEEYTGEFFAADIAPNIMFYGLEPATVYYASVAALCDAVEYIYSQWSEDVKFITFGAPTGLDSIQNSAVSHQKVVRDGQLFLIIDGKTYNAQGVEVK